MIPRPYQQAAGEALDECLATRDDNPLIVIPTGGGKTPTMAWTIQRYLKHWPATRICVLAHIKELLVQGVEKMDAIWPWAPVGIYSAGVGRKEMSQSITYAGIQSVYRHGCKFDPFDLIFVDEAHRVPLSAEGQYRQFFRDCRLQNPHLRIVGWTATPYRLGGGTICGQNYIFQDIAYEVGVRDLIDQGYLAKLRTKAGAAAINTAGVRHSRGEFDAKALEQRVMAEGVEAIAEEITAICNRENRQSILIFCVSVSHAEAMRDALAPLGITAPVIHGGTAKAERDRLGADFKSGQLRALVNVNVLSEGFDATRVDCVVMVRPTESHGLYYQQVGRGLRLHPGKTDCLILDFAGNVARHGPIDRLAGHAPELATCGECQEVFDAPCGACPQCGWTIPPKEAAGAAGGGERFIPNDPRARTEAAILSGDDPWEMIVDSVSVRLHEKTGKPASLCVTYTGPGGIESHREWICLGHPPGFAKLKAKAWWRSRFSEPVPESAEQAMADRIFMASEIEAMTQSITVRHAGKYTEVVNVKFTGQEAGAVAR